MRASVSLRLVSSCALLGLAFPLLTACTSFPFPGRDSSSSGGETVSEDSSVVGKLVDRKLVFAGGVEPEVEGKSFTLKADGTVEADSQASAYLSHATHWRGKANVLDLCTDQTCEFYSEWVLDDHSGQVEMSLYGSQSLPVVYVLTIE